jgi:hypothetical protein
MLPCLACLELAHLCPEGYCHGCCDTAGHNHPGTATRKERKD